MTKTGMLIGDDEIRERFPEEAELIIDKLNRDPATQAYEAVWHGKRFRPAVEQALAARAEHSTKAAG